MSNLKSKKVKKYEEKWTEPKRLWTLSSVTTCENWSLRGEKTGNREEKHIWTNYD